MANTVNGVSAITLATHRERAGISTGANFIGVYDYGQVLRARFYIDTAGDFALDDPNAFSAFGRNWNTSRIYLVGLVYIAGTHTLTIKSGTTTLAVLNGILGFDQPYRDDHVLFATNEGQALVFNATSVSVTNTLVGTAYYVIADSMRSSQ